MQARAKPGLACLQAVKIVAGCKRDYQEVRKQDLCRCKSSKLRLLIGCLNCCRRHVPRSGSVAGRFLQICKGSRPARMLRNRRHTICRSWTFPPAAEQKPYLFTTKSKITVHTQLDHANRVANSLKNPTAKYLRNKTKVSLENDSSTTVRQDASTLLGDDASTLPWKDTVNPFGYHSSSSHNSIAMPPRNLQRDLSKLFGVP